MLALPERKDITCLSDSGYLSLLKYYSLHYKYNVELIGSFLTTQELFSCSCFLYYFSCFILNLSKIAIPLPRPLFRALELSTAKLDCRGVSESECKGTAFFRTTKIFPTFFFIFHAFFLHFSSIIDFGQGKTGKF